MAFRTLSFILLAIGGVSFIALMTTSVSDAIMRGFGLPLIGAKEISEALLVTCIAIAIPVSVYRGKAISVDGIVVFFPDLLEQIFTAAGNLIGAALCALLSYQLIHAGADAGDFAEQSALLKIPHKPLYQILAIGFGLTAPAFLYRAWLSYYTDKQVKA